MANMEKDDLAESEYRLRTELRGAPAHIPALGAVRGQRALPNRQAHTAWRALAWRSVPTCGAPCGSEHAVCVKNMPTEKHAH